MSETSEPVRVPGLTEEMLRAVESARNMFRNNQVEYARLAEECTKSDDRYFAYRDVERNCKDDADAIDALLARDAALAATKGGE